MNDIYSYHTFLFPFIWANTNSSSEHKINMDQYIDDLRLLEYWKEISWCSEDIPKQGKEDYRLDYAAFQYFTAPANNLIFGTTSGKNRAVIRRFEFSPDKKRTRNIGTYEITKRKLRDPKDKNSIITEIFKLNMSGIKLNIYNTGVAVMSFELEYFGEKYVQNGDKPDRLDGKTIDDVNKINEFGRRINLPFLMGEDALHPLVADIVGLHFTDGLKDGTIEENFQKTLEEELRDKDNRQCISLTYVSIIIKSLLEYGGGKRVTSNPSHSNADCFCISPVIDDRMYVCCIVRDEEFSRCFSAYDSPNNEKLLSSNGLSQDIYKFSFIETSLSCPGITMRQELLKRCIYGRWLGWGTLYTVTHHSFVCVTGTDPVLITTVINPFLTQYVQMATIALVQRATLLMLSMDCAKLAAGLSTGKSLSNKTIQNISMLEEKYIKAQNEVLVFEITVQEQGVELFDMLRNELYIPKNTELLEKQLNNLYEMSQSYSTRRINNTVMSFGIIGVFVGLLQVIIGILSLFKFGFTNPYILLFFVQFPICIFIVVTMWFYLKNKSK